MIVLLTISLQAEMRLAVSKEGFFSTNGIEKFKMFGENKVLAMSQSKNSYSKILIDCLD